MKTKGRSYTGLMLAAYGGHAAAVAELLKAGARIGLCNKHFKNAREIAVERGHRECARLLKKPLESMLELSDAQIKKLKMKSVKSLLKEFSIPCKGCVHISKLGACQSRERSTAARATTRGRDRARLLHSSPRRARRDLSQPRCRVLRRFDT